VASQAFVFLKRLPAPYTQIYRSGHCGTYHSDFPYSCIRLITTALRVQLSGLYLEYESQGQCILKIVLRSLHSSLPVKLKLFYIELQGRMSSSFCIDLQGRMSSSFCIELQGRMSGSFCIELQGRMSSSFCIELQGRKSSSFSRKRVKSSPILESFL